MTDEIWERVALDWRRGVEVLCIGTSGKPMGFAIAAPERRRRRRRFSLTAALRQAAKAGTPVGAAIVQSDGGIALSFGDATDANASVESEWDKLLRGKIQ